MTEAKKIKITCTINGKKTTFQTFPMTRLIDAIRDSGLTGTKEGCGEGECGACSIIMDGRLVNSCLIPAVQAEGAKLTTVEGLGEEKKLSKLQKAFHDHNGAQCGFCTPGMLMASHHLLERYPKPSEAQVREGLAGNLCRCTGYMKIFTAVKSLSKGGKK